MGIRELYKYITENGKGVLESRFINKWEVEWNKWLLKNYWNGAVNFFKKKFFTGKFIYLDDLMKKNLRNSFKMTSEYIFLKL